MRNATARKKSRKAFRFSLDDLTKDVVLNKLRFD